MFLLVLQKNLNFDHMFYLDFLRNRILGAKNFSNGEWKFLCENPLLCVNERKILFPSASFLKFSVLEK